MGSRSASLREEGYEVLFSYEEAIGYCLGDVVKDKDGVAAAAVFAEMADYIRVEKKMTVAAHLESLYQSVGYDSVCAKILGYATDARTNCTHNRRAWLW